MSPFRKSNKTSLKIAHVLDSLQIGGMERFVTDLAKKQKAAGHEVKIFTVSDGGPFAQELNAAGIPIDIYEKTPGFDLRFLIHLMRRFKDGRFDVIHTHNPYANTYGVLAGRMAGVRRILNTRHGMGNFPFDRRREALFKWVSQWIDYVVFVCLKAQDSFQECKIVHPDKSRVVYNGIDLSRYEKLNQNDYEDVRRELGLSATDRIIGCVARLNPAKDLGTLLSALPTVLEEFPDAHVVLVGGGGLFNDLTQLARRLNIEKNVHLLGERSDIPRLLTAMDLFVLPSVTEGMALTLIEAMAAGRPIIATNVGGNPEVVIDQFTGVIIEPGQPDILASEIKQYFRYPSLGMTYGENARKRAFSAFSIDQMKDSYMELYQSGIRVTRVFMICVSCCFL